MQLHDAIGIDPDSKACVASLVRRDGSQTEYRTFQLTNAGRDSLHAFITSVPGVLIGIEGRRGQSSPLEIFFEENGLIYHSIPSLNVASYRTAMVGQQKSNRDDARAVAEFLLDIETKGRLGEYARHDKPDTDLRLLARERLRMGQEMALYQNRLWDLVKESAHDLYLALNGSGEEDTNKTSMCSKRLLRLFIALPDISKWSSIEESKLLELTGGKKATGWENFMTSVCTPLASNRPLGLGNQIVIRNAAQTLLQMIEQKAELEAALDISVEERESVKAVRDHYDGIGNFTAALIVSEIITIDRFANDDRLASYAGLTKRSFSTGTNLNQRKASSCNKRLKYGFVTFAKCYLRSTGDKHLIKYHQLLLDRGMSRMEALKRIARALSRDLYRYMKELSSVKEKGKSVA